MAGRGCHHDSTRTLPDPRRGTGTRAQLQKAPWKGQQAALQGLGASGMDAPRGPGSVLCTAGIPSDRTRVLAAAGTGLFPKAHVFPRSTVLPTGPPPQAFLSVITTPGFRFPLQAISGTGISTGTLTVLFVHH